MKFSSNRGVSETGGSKKSNVLFYAVVMSLLIKSVISFTVLPPHSKRVWSMPGGIATRFASISSNDAASSETNLDSSVTAKQRLFPEELNVLYDSKCNVCKLEMEWLASRDSRINTEQPKLKLTDLEDPKFDAGDPANGGINYETGMAAIYAVTADGKVLKGVPAFALAYEQVGLGWLWGIYNVPGVKQVFNLGYNVFARYRTRLTRGSTLEELVEFHNQKQRQLAQDSCQTCRKL